MILSLLISLALISLGAYWYSWRRKQTKFFEDLGIPGPKPHLITGNLREYISKGFTTCQVEWTNKFGNCVGYFLGTKPILLIGEPDILRDIQIKEFLSFADRPPSIPGGQTPVGLASDALIALKGQSWKRVRNVLTPAFSSSKLKQLTQLINDAVNILLNKIREKASSGQRFDIYQFYEQITLDIISRAAFGIKTNSQKDTNHFFLTNVQKMLKSSISKTAFLIQLCFPELLSLFIPFRRLVELIRIWRGTSPIGQLLEACAEVVELRRKSSKERRADLLQLMLDAQMSNELGTFSNSELTSNADSQCFKTKLSNENLSDLGQNYISNSEILANCLLFLLAGYETTCTTLGFTTHFLVNHPQIQEKLRNEVNSMLEKEKDLDYSSTSKLQYLDQVLSEVLRMYPPVPAFVNRECVTDYRYGTLYIPKGTTVQVPVWALHYNPVYWTEPEKFDPERFSPNQSQPSSLVYQPFGAGPRNCIGKRFALLEIKIVVAQILRHFILKPDEKTGNGQIMMKEKLFQVVPGSGIIVVAESI
ncbi:cytochrome P450 3A5-like [Tachypleus tridentatus]|uniref:cytochrome P450 3A5-like n=1 Tax=Tachypleus tridentatus TaxID=6853 RepID=UPI003FD6367D